MTSVNYPSPVVVNGYSCKNCTDVDYAKKNIDPAHPTDGPFGVNAKAKPSSTPSSGIPSPAVTFSGVLAGRSASVGAGAQPGAIQGPRPVTDTAVQSTATQGLRLDISV